MDELQSKNEGSVQSDVIVTALETAPSKPNGTGGSPVTETFRPIVSNHVKDWDRMLCTLNRGHWDAARYYDGWDTWLGGAAFLTSFVAGSAAFTQVANYADNQSGNVWVQILVGVFALLSGLLGAAKSQAGLSSMASMHKIAGQKFGMLRREFDEIQEVGFSSLEQERAGLKAFREKWDAVETDLPPVPKRSMDRATREVRSTEDHVERLLAVPIT